MICNAPEPMFPGGFMVRPVGGGWVDATGAEFVPGPLQRSLLRHELETQRKQVSEQVLEAVAGRPLSEWRALESHRKPWETWVDIHHPGIIPSGLFQ